MSERSEAVIRKRSVPSRRRRDGLIQYASDATSQHGEDGILERLFELLLKNVDSHTRRDVRHCVDVGAWDGKHLSNTYSLLVKPRQQAWRGVLIEADRSKFASLRQLHEPLGNICLNASVSCRPESPESLVKLLRQHASDLPQDFDFLCIDVDGTDYWLLHQLWNETHCRYRPTVVCIEFNPTIPDDLVYIPPRCDRIRHGASLSALCELASEHDYTLVETTLYNAFFVPTHLYETFLRDLIPDTSIEALHDSTMSTQLYQLYDGTLKLWGCRKLLWHRLPITEEAIQVLPRNNRTFPFAPESESESTARIQEEEATWLYDKAIDMSSYCIPSPDSPAIARQQCVEQLWRRLQQDGFALVRGTGISQSQCRQALHMTNAFLQDADESVRRSCLAKDRARRGYSPMCTENFASLIGQQCPNDLVRKFRLGPDHDSDSVKMDSSPLFQSNVWPTEEWIESEAFQKTISSYYDASCAAANAIVEAICDGVRNENPHLEGSIQSTFMRKDDSLRHTSILTLLGYRPGTRHKRKEKPPLVAPHTDVGVITFLLFESGGCASLQRASCEDSDEWIDVRLPSSVGDDPIFVVNIADCLSELSGDILPSTVHRVIPCTSNPTPRNCMALFVGLDPTQTICLPSGATVSYEEWRRCRIANAQAVLKLAQSSHNMQT